LLGLLNGESRPELKRNITSRGLPNFTTRRSHDDLGMNATVRGFSYVPVYNSINNIWVDNLNLDGCDYPIKKEAEMRTIPETYGFANWLIDDLRHVYKTEFSLNDTHANNLTFKEAFGYSDYIISERMNFGNCTKYDCSN
jgi:hypothetical protein